MVVAPWLWPAGGRLYCARVLCRCALAAILVVNHWSTGLPNDQPLLFFWRSQISKSSIAGVRFRSLCSFTAGTRRSTLAAPPLLSREFIWDLQHFFRGYLLYPLVGGGLSCWYRRNSQAFVSRRAVAIAGQTPVVALASAIIAFVIFAAAVRPRAEHFVFPLLELHRSGSDRGGRRPVERFARPDRAALDPAHECGVLVAPLVVAGVFAATVASFPDGRPV